MKKSRGNKKSAVAIEARRNEVIRLTNEGLVQGEIQKALGVSRATLWRDLQELKLGWAIDNRENYNECREKQLQILERIEDSIISGDLKPEAANSLRNIRSDIAKLLGLNSPTKSLVAHVNLEELRKTPVAKLSNEQLLLEIGEGNWQTLMKMYLGDLSEAELKIVEEVVAVAVAQIIGERNAESVTQQDQIDAEARYRDRMKSTPAEGMMDAMGESLEPPTDEEEPES